MNTNDPAAKYGKPMLSDEEISALKPFMMTIDLSVGEITDAVSMPMNAFQVRDFYESLIHEGRLRVVEECGYTPADTWCSVCICHSCHEACSEAGEAEPYPYCPFCTRKIIKPTNP